MFINKHKSAVRLYKYDEAIAIERAAIDLLKGTAPLLEDMDGTKLMTELKHYCTNQTIAHLTPEILTQYTPHEVTKESLSHKVTRILSLNGLLLPNFIDKGPMYFGDERYPKTHELFGHSKIYYIKPNTKQVLIATFDRKQILLRILNRCVIALRLLLAHKKLKIDFTENAAFMTSERFWRSKFNI